VVVDTGYLYLHGNPIEPPYIFTIAGDSLYAELYINDYIAHRSDKRPRDFESLSPFEKFVREVGDRLRQMRKEGTTTVMERTEVAAEMYRRRPEYIDSVKILSPGSLDIVRLDASGCPYHENFIVESGRRIDPPTAYETVANRMELLVHRLSMGWTVFNWRGFLGYYPSLPDSGFAAWLEERSPRSRERLGNPLPLEKRRR